MTKAQKIEDDETSLGKDFGTFKEDFDKFKEDQDLLGEKVCNYTKIMYLIIWRDFLKIKQKIARETRFEVNLTKWMLWFDDNFEFCFFKVNGKIQTLNDNAHDIQDENEKIKEQIKQLEG